MQIKFHILHYRSITIKQLSHIEESVMKRFPEMSARRFIITHIFKHFKICSFIIADLKICQYFHLHMKKYAEDFTLKHFLRSEICAREMWKSFFTNI